MSDEKGLRFETGLIVIFVLCVAITGVVLAFGNVFERLDRIESAQDGPQPTARSLLRETQ